MERPLLLQNWFNPSRCRRRDRRPDESEPDKLKYGNLKNKIANILNDKFNRRIHPVQAIMFFAGLLALVLGIIARFVVNERILKVVLVLLVTVSVLALLCIAGIVLAYLYQMAYGAIHRRFGDREDYRLLKDPPVDISQLCHPSGKNLEFSSGEEMQTPRNAIK
jgi:hypothetical protein